MGHCVARTECCQFHLTELTPQLTKGEALMAGLPLVDAPNIPGGILAQANGVIPGIDLGIAVYSWFNTSTRTYWASFDLMFGAAPLDTSIGMVIATGTPS